MAAEKEDEVSRDPEIMDDNILISDFLPNKPDKQILAIPAIADLNPQVSVGLVGTAHRVNLEIETIASSRNNQKIMDLI